jgi:probable HAF family extracellular repeat protein
VANHGFLYSGGPLVDLGTLGGSWCYPQGINNSGQVVGYSVTASNFEHAFLYSGGAMFDLNNLANTNSIGAGFYFPIANGINDSGQIIANGSNGRAYLLTPIAPATYLAGNLRPELQPPAATGGNIQFNWNLLNTSPAVGYQVQYTTNLVSGPWLNLGGVQTTTSFTDTASSDKQRFYRVMLVQ